MKILMTGHTRGIGKALYDALITDGHDVIGYSRSTGHDILEGVCRDLIVSESLSADVFINNAFAKDSQYKLALEMWTAWKDCNKTGTIINIGSRAAYDHEHRKIPILYDMYKIGLREMSLHLSRLNDKVRISHVAFGYVDTESVADKNAPKLELAQTVAAVRFILSMPTSVQVRELCMEQK